MSHRPPDKNAGRRPVEMPQTDGREGVHVVVEEGAKEKACEQHFDTSVNRLRS